MATGRCRFSLTRKKRYGSSFTSLSPETCTANDSPELGNDSGASERSIANAAGGCTSHRTWTTSTMSCSSCGRRATVQRPCATQRRAARSRVRAANLEGKVQTQQAHRLGEARPAAERQEAAAIAVDARALIRRQNKHKHVIRPLLLLRQHLRVGKAKILHAARQWLLCVRTRARAWPAASVRSRRLRSAQPASLAPWLRALGSGT
jgi:hypothetical protein